jgi:hypothetical protein
VAAAAAALLSVSTSVGRADDPTTVTVGATSVGPISMQITTNSVWSGMIDQFPAAKANFAALKLPLVRLHVGDDGDPVAMPEVKKNSWSFAALDVLVNDVTSTGQQPVMNVKFAPDWMWTCTKMGQKGRVADLTFATYADYMARLVSYYNKGSMTTEAGQTITNKAGTKNRIVYWELWNEPDLSNETPCNPPSGQALTPSEYLTMWNAVTPKMLAVDPGLRFIGPATAGGQFGSSAGVGNDYITTLMRGARTAPYALSFHGYGYWDNTVTDKWIFDGDNTGAGGIPDFVKTASLVHRIYPERPIWITEMNVNADWGADPHGRPWGPFGAAWWASAYIRLAPLNVALLDQYNLAEGPQFGLIDDQTGKPFLPYWVVKTLNAGFPLDSVRLQSSSTDGSIQTLAARRPDGKVSILVVNRRVDAGNARGGKGLPATVQIVLNGLAPTALSLQQVDATTSAAKGPPATGLPASEPITLHFPGYGLALLTVSVTGGPTVRFKVAKAPTVSGRPTVGSTLRATPATWTLRPARASYQWQICSTKGCTSIAGATRLSLKVAGAYAGRSVRFVATATANGTTLKSSSRRVAIKRR